MAAEPRAGLLHADPGWLFAVVDDGLVAAGPQRELEVEIDAPFEARRRLLGALTSPGGVDATALAEPAGSEPAEAEELCDRLREAGALVAEPDARSAHEVQGTRLCDAIIAAAHGRAVNRWVWTAAELLVLPESADAALVRRAVRTFVAGLSGDASLRAYCYVALWTEPTVRGDLPGPDRRTAGQERAAELDPEAVHVVDLATGRVQGAPAGRIGRLGAGQAHRLGPVLAEGAVELPGGLEHRVAVYAVPNLRHPRAARERIGRGTAVDPEQAGLIARAEAAERYAAGDSGRHELTRASGAKLGGAVTIDDLGRFNRRQLGTLRGADAHDPSEARLWTRAEARDRSSRWVPAEAVFLPFEDPERPGRMFPSSSSSGLAAHTDPGEAIERAVNELIERDAFMWHWVQGISRERIDPASLPPALRERLEAVEAGGFEARLVNLTLETRPVVLCGLMRAGGMFAGAGCSPSAATAAAKALSEALLVASTIGAESDPERISPEEVVGPLDHARLHRQAGVAAGSRFLVSSPEAVGVNEIETRQGPAAEAVAPVGELLTVDLTSPATKPYSVARALVPGAVPISFGHDREPLGMQRLAEPQRTLDGRILGRPIDLDDAGPLLPHPFA